MGVMLDCTLSTEQLAELRVGHRRTRDKREADRIKAVVLLATGWSAEEVAEVLLVDPNTVRAHFKRYREDGLEGLRRVGEGVGGSIGLLDTKQLAQLDAHLQTNLYLSAKAVGHWAKETFGVSYTESGMTAVLHRLGYVYKKPRLVPGKADREAQEQFLETYDNIRNTKGQDDPIIFMDATHPQHNPVLAGGWIKRGEEQEIPTNTGRRRVNINGAIDLERLEPVVRFDVFFFQAEDGIRYTSVTGVQTCALPIFGLSELYYLGALLFRRGIKQRLDRWIAEDYCTVKDADEIVRLIATDNARRIYPLGDA